MKITALKCPKCGARLKILDKEAQTAHCEYCGHDFILEKEAPKAQNTTDTVVYHRTAASSRKASPVVGIVVAIIVVSTIIPVIIAILVSSRAFDVQGSAPPAFAGAEQFAPRTIPQSELICAFAEHVFRKSADEVTPEEYSSLRYLQITFTEFKVEWFEHYSLPQGYSIQYGFEDTLTVAGAEINSYFYPTRNGDDLISWQDMQCFSGLTVLDLGGIRNDIIDDSVEDPYPRESSDCDLRNLESLRVYRGSYYQSLSNVTFADPGMLQELTLRLNKKGDMDLLPEFVNLEILRVDYFTQDFDLSWLSVLPKLHTLEVDRVSLSDISGLSALTGLQHLYFYACSDITDYSVLYGLPGLLTLHLERASNLKDIGFVANMPKLQHFALIDSDVLDIEALRNKLSLLSLVLESNDELKDLSAVATLTSLQSLAVLDYHLQLPDLSAFANLHTARIRGAQFPSIAGSNTITRLHLLNAEVSGTDFSQMESLASLRLQSCDLLDPAGLELLPALTSLQIVNSTNRNDCSLIFNLPVLERLEIASILRINRDEIHENTVLKVLSIQEDLYFPLPRGEENTAAYGSISDVFAKLTGLEELYLPEIKLESAEFLSRLQKLRVLDISENYINDVGPVANLPNIEVLYYGGNPISNLALMPDTVTLYDCRMPFLIEF